MPELTVLEHRKEVHRQAVQQGARLLDSRMPDWYSHIDLGKLDMANGCLCIVGQTSAAMMGFTSFTQGLTDLEIMGEGEDYGFVYIDPDTAVFRELYEQEVRWVYHDAEIKLRWTALEHLWVEAIKERYERFGGDPVTL